ncbi:integral membrane sensor signal transduction histidine kinase [Actinobacteria bacterium OV320]|nr:integral membrane sensor signal transduction histidine kinase [Actinobacteria bacterium OV320]
MNVEAVGRIREAGTALVRPVAPLPRPTRRNLLFDALLALVLAVAATVYALSAGVGRSYLLVDGMARVRTGADTWAGAVVPALLVTLPLALRRRFPLAVLWVVLGAGILAPDGEARIVFYSLVVATYSAIAFSPYRAAIVAGLPPALLVLASIGDAGVPAVPDRDVPLLVLLPLAMAAYGIRTWRARADERQTRMAELARERAAELRRAAEQERARIARELHDVVTHHVSVMVIQAGAARTVLDAAPAQSREALLAIEAGGRAAMTELRHAMGLLLMNFGDDRDDIGAVSADTAPPPGLDRVEELVARVRACGLPVELTVTGARLPVPAGIDLAAYRVVQEALTNTMKHAAGSRATVTIAYGESDLGIEVTDTGGAPGAAAGTGDGHGLLGLRERLGVYGATLRNGPAPDGGYRVAALIPLLPRERTT